jgi:uroporphyrinogen-III synthase
MPGNDHQLPLSGYCIWITRPQHQSAGLAAQLQALGAEVLLQPLLAISAYENPQSRTCLSQLANYDLVIFVSANALEYALPYLHMPKIKPEFAAIGSATAAKCRENGINVDYVPEQADSDGLLAMPRFEDIKAQQILIVRGVGGRAYLGEQLQRRGAQVEYAEVYQRQRPEVSLSAAFVRADAILITSSEALAHLVELAQRDKQDWVFDKQLVLIHERIAGRAGELGFTLNPLVARQANDAGLVEALVDRALSAKERASE